MKTQQSVISESNSFMKECLHSYRQKLRYTSRVNGVSNRTMVANTMETLIVCLVLEKAIKENIIFRRAMWFCGLNPEKMKRSMEKTEHIELELEQIVAITDFLDTTFTELKKLALKQIMIANEYQVLEKAS